MKSSILRKAAITCLACVIATGCIGLFGCGGSESNSSTQSSSALTKAADPIGKHHAVIQIKGYDPITVELDGDSAPVSVQNFMDLAEGGFYNGLTLHRIIEGFMMQGGDPKGDGTGGNGDKTIIGEFTSNGIDNKLKNTRGAIAMARSNDPNSASSQFYIVQQDSSWLDGDYAVFGNVTDGLDVVDAICESAKPSDSNGTIPAKEQPVIESITITD